MSSRLNGTAWEVLRVLAIIGGTVIAMLVAFGGEMDKRAAAHDRPIEARIEAVEHTQQRDYDRMNARLDRIETKLDRLLEREAEKK